MHTVVEITNSKFIAGIQKTFAWKTGTLLLRLTKITPMRPVRPDPIRPPASEVNIGATGSTAAWMYGKRHMACYLDATD